VVIQASLHADEVPGMLVAHHLRGLLATLEAEGRLLGEVVLIPCANPIGMGQWLLHGYQGRFELGSGQNFNRHFENFTDRVWAAVEGRCGADPTANVALVRAALKEAAAAVVPSTELESLRKTLLTLAIDADAVLDLHCDGEAVLHLYTTPATWAQAEPLARCLGAEVVLLAERSGGDPYDEACSMVWVELAQKLGPQRPLPAACMAATIELRGEADVSHELASGDARALVDYLVAARVVAASANAAANTSSAAPPLPPLRCEPTPLAGSIPLVAPHGGIVVFLLRPGTVVSCGQALIDLIDPTTGDVTTLTSPVDGLFFARDLRRSAVAGMSLGKVAGRTALRQGKLLSA
jgi:predicted deacylase